MLHGSLALACCCSTPRSYQSKGLGLFFLLRTNADWLHAFFWSGKKVKLQVPYIIHHTSTNSSFSPFECLEGDFPTFLSEFGGGDCRWDFNDLDFLGNHHVIPFMPLMVFCNVHKVLLLWGNPMQQWNWPSNCSARGERPTGNRPSDDQLLT